MHTGFIFITSGAKMTQIQDFEELTRNTRRVEFNDGLQDFQNAAVFLF
jgi:hypothetical protein